MKNKIYVISIGDELLKGFTLNTNLLDMGATLTESGLVLDGSMIIPDTKKSIIKTIESAIDIGADIIITTGGLGPTVDDLTKGTIATHLNLDLFTHPELLESLEQYWKDRTKPMPKNISSQAELPQGAVYFPNDCGTAVGIVVKCNLNSSKLDREQYIIMLPGPPNELKPMFKNHVIPFLNSLQSEKQHTKTIKIIALSESIVERRTLHLIDQDQSIAYCASPDMVKVYITGINQQSLNKTEKRIREELEGDTLPYGIESTCEYIIQRLKAKNLTLSCAESCTGGLIASEITNTPGASEVFKGSVITYSNEWKKDLLQIPKQLLQEHGAVSSECALAMVNNLCSIYKSDVGISVTGIAGPSGGSAEKPVGLVYIAVKINNKSFVKKYILRGDRSTIRRKTVASAFNLLNESMKVEKYESTKV